MQRCNLVISCRWMVTGLLLIGLNPWSDSLVKFKLEYPPTSIPLTLRSTEWNNPFTMVRQTHLPSYESRAPFGHGLSYMHSDTKVLNLFCKKKFFMWILRKQCVNKLFQLRVFFEIQWKSQKCKWLIFNVVLLRWKFMEYQFFRLIIWRSLVQAQAGPQRKRLIPKGIQLFFFMETSD